MSKSAPLWVASGSLLALVGVIVLSLRQNRARRELQAGYQRLRTDFARANERGESFRGEKTRILRLATEDLAAPLRELEGELERLSAIAAQSPEVATHLDRIAQPLTRIRRSITALNELRALEERSQALTLLPVNVGAILIEAVANARELAAQRNVRLSVPSPSKTATAMADAMVLRRVLENLLGDAIEVTPSGGAVSLALYQTSDRVLVTVADEGPGAAVADQAQLLSQSGHSRPPFSASEGGVRLNLAMVHNLIKAMDGWLWSQSEPGRGTTHVVELALPSATPTKK